MPRKNHNIKKIILPKKPKPSLSKIRTRINNNSLKLKFSERISRILLVIGTFSLIGLLFQKMLTMLGNVFNTLYINTEIPIGPEHILIPILLSDITLFFFFCLFYCFSELYNLTDYSEKKYKLKYQLNSDRCYKRILGILIICISLTFITFLITIILFLITDYFRLFLIITFSLGIIWALFNARNIISYLKVFLLNFHINIEGVLISWIMLSFLFFSLGVAQFSYGEQNYVVFKFNNNNTIDLDIQFENKIPKEVLIQSDKSEIAPIKIEKKDFFMAYVEATKENFNDGKELTPITNQFMYKQSFYEYHYKTNIDKLIQEGTNTIIITFEIDGLANTKKSYKIINQINNINGKYELVRKEFNISL